MRYILIGVFVVLCLLGQTLPTGLFHFGNDTKVVDHQELKGTKFYDIKIHADSISNDKTCYADFKHKPLGTATVVAVTYERGLIMGKYHIKEQGGRWYYQEFFENFRCVKNT